MRNHFLLLLTCAVVSISLNTAHAQAPQGSTSGASNNAGGYLPGHPNDEYMRNRNRNINTTPGAPQNRTTARMNSSTSRNRAAHNDNNSMRNGVNPNGSSTQGR